MHKDKDCQRPQARGRARRIRRPAQRWAVWVAGASKLSGLQSVLGKINRKKKLCSENLIWVSGRGGLIGATGAGRPRVTLDLLFFALTTFCELATEPGGGGTPLTPLTTDQLQHPGGSLRRSSALRSAEPPRWGAENTREALWSC